MGNDPPNGRPTVFTLSDQIAELKVEIERRWRDEQEELDRHMSDRLKAVHREALQLGDLPKTLAGIETALAALLELVPKSPAGALVISSRQVVWLVGVLAVVTIAALGGLTAADIAALAVKAFGP